jgi:carboxyl-terminal processing protease
MLDSLQGKASSKNGQLRALSAAGGIIPDFWVTGRPYTDFYQEMYRSGLFEDIAIKILDDPKSSVQAYRTSLDGFISGYREDGRLLSLVQKSCRARGITFDAASFLRDRTYVALAVRSRIAHQLFGFEGQIRVFVSGADPLVRIAGELPVAP